MLRVQGSCPTKTTGGEKLDKKTMPMAVMAAIMLVSLYFVLAGVGMHAQVNTEEANFHKLQSKYWSISKAERDAAPGGSELNQKLVEIQNYPSELLRLKLVGIGNILAGIYALLFGILIALVMMPKRLGMVLQEKGKP